MVRTLSKRIPIFALNELNNLKDRNMKKTIILLAALLLAGTSARLMAQAVNVQDVPGGVPERPAFDFPQPDIMFNLWPDGAPTDNGLTGEERDFGNHVSNVTKPTLAVFLPENPNGLAILVCPGG